MLRLIRLPLSAATLCIVLLLTTTSIAEIGGPSKRAPDFTLKRSTGGNVKLSELRGRVVLVNFWATWCTPCKEELPYFNRLYGRYRNLGLEILGVNIDKVSSQGSQMSAALGLAFPVLLDPGGTTSDVYQIRSMPTTYVVAKDGTVRHVHWGFGPDDPERYEAELRALLKE
jgi:peroxiredoxin